MFGTWWSMLADVAAGESICGWAKELGFELEAGVESTTLHRGWDLSVDFRLLLLVAGPTFGFVAAVQNRDASVALMCLALATGFGVLAVRTYRSGTYAEARGLVFRRVLWTRWYAWTEIRDIELIRRDPRLEAVLESGRRVGLSDIELDQGLLKDPDVQWEIAVLSWWLDHARSADSGN